MVSNEKRDEKRKKTGKDIKLEKKTYKKKKMTKLGLCLRWKDEDEDEDVMVNELFD